MEAGARAHQAQERVGTDIAPQPLSFSGTGASCRDIANQVEFVTQSLCLSGVDGGKVGEPLGEDALLTGGIVTEELARSEMYRHRTMRPGQVGQGSGVVAMDAHAEGCTAGTM